jgi:CheY-like chemotaxis protein
MREEDRVVQTVQILLVDDDDVDAETVLRGFKKHKIANPITVCDNGADALKKLRGDDCEPLTRPYIILLDLNMPGMNGFEFLDELRADSTLQNSVVFVLTTSKAKEDRARSYKHNVAGYIVKSNVGPSFQLGVEMLGAYWTTVTLPA